MTNADYVAQLHPSIQPKVQDFLAKALAQGFDLRITAGLRTPQEQQALYNQGRTTPGNIVTYSRGIPPESNHIFGLAVDIVDRTKGYNIDWDKLGAIGESCGLEWGGRW